MPLREIIRTVKCPIESSTQEELRDALSMVPWVKHAGSMLSRCQKGRDGRPFERLHGNRPKEFSLSVTKRWLGRFQQNPGSWPAAYFGTTKCYVGAFSLSSPRPHTLARPQVVASVQWVNNALLEDVGLCGNIGFSHCTSGGRFLHTQRFEKVPRPFLVAHQAPLLVHVVCLPTRSQVTAM